MAKKDPTDKDVQTNKGWESKPQESFDAYCPRCSVWYPSSSNAHAGH